MAEFLVEVYLADHSTARAARRAAQATDAPAGASARCLRSIVVPEDETCFLLYEAPSAEAVLEAVRRAGLQPEHVSAAQS
jgi:hypothetical protein